MTNKYRRTLHGWAPGSDKPMTMDVDVYRVLDGFQVTDPCLQHLTKKALAAGSRGHKDLTTDLNDIVASAQQAVALHQQKHELQPTAQADPVAHVDQQITIEITGCLSKTAALKGMTPESGTYWVYDCPHCGVTLDTKIGIAPADFIKKLKPVDLVCGNCGHPESEEDLHGGRRSDHKPTHTTVTKSQWHTTVTKAQRPFTPPSFTEDTSLQQAYDALLAELAKVQAGDPDQALAMISNVRNRLRTAQRDAAKLRRDKSLGDLQPSPFFAGKTVVITGSFSWASRTAVKNALLASGAKVRGSVCSNTDILIVGQMPGSKAQRARELGITCLAHYALREMLRKNPTR